MAFANAGNTVSFPLGFYDDPDDATGGSTGAMEIKAAWRILYPSLGDDPNRFYNIQARVYVPAGESKDGTAFCFEARLGLVGFHVIQRTTDPQDGGARQSWNWATFEHVDNAPLATNAGDPATTDAGPTTCEPPDTDTRYSFYDPACTGCTPNGPPPTPSPGSGYLWESTAPYGREYANPGGFGTQVVRCWRIYDETRELNERFQQAFTGSVWANYRLLNTQWQSSLDIPPFDPISIPTYLGNAVIETYIQSESDCLGCHAFATTTAGQDANFSFLLSYAQ